MSKTFDRSQFKGASSAANRAVVKEAVDASSTSKGGRADYHKIEDGKNIFRIAPPHNKDSPSVQPVSKTWLEIEVADKDGAKELKKRPIFSSKIHSPVGVDVVDAYIEYATKLAYSTLSKDDARKKLAPINGWKGSDGRWNQGIKHSLGFVAYAWKEEKLGRVELSQTVVNRMNELSIDEESDETISVDPFSDPDSGVSLIVTYDKGADASKKYSVNRGMTPKPLSDSQLEDLLAQEPLADMFSNAFTKEDFKKSLEGLQRFDTKHKFNLFQIDEFLDIVEGIADKIESCPDIRENNKSEDEQSDASSSAPVKSAVPDDVDVINKKFGAPNGKAPIKEVNEPSEESEDGLEELTKEELVELISERNLGITIKPVYTKSKLIALIRESTSGSESQSPVAEERNEAWEALKAADGLNPTPIDEPSVDDRVAAMKARMARG